MEKHLNEIIHVCFSPSAGGSLKHAVKKKKLFKGKKIIVFADDISQGIIEKGIRIEKRIEWWNNIDKEDERIHLNQIDYLKESYSKFYKEISQITDSQLIYLWYGESSCDICGMMHTLEFLKDKLDNIYLINVSGLIEKTSNGTIYSYRSVSEIITEKLSKFIEIKRKITPNEYKNFIKDWNCLKNNNSLLRVFKDGKVKSVDENYFDINILKYTEKEFKKSARIVGSVMGVSERKISDDYIFWRVQELVKLGMLEFKGKFGIMREMEIKITEKGLEYLSNDSEAILYWKNRQEELQEKIDIINEAKQQGRMEEKISIAKKLMSILDIEIIAEKTGLTVEQVNNLNINSNKL